MNFTKNSIDHIKSLINSNNIKDALEILNHSADKSLLFQNARAVCFMRENLLKEAIDLLRSLVFHDKSITADRNVPEMIHLNLAEAMLISGNISGAQSLINACDEQSEQKEKLIQAVANWKRSLPFWKKLDILFGTLPYNTPIPVQSPWGSV